MKSRYFGSGKLAFSLEEPHFCSPGFLHVLFRLEEAVIAYDHRLLFFARSGCFYFAWRVISAAHYCSPQVLLKTKNRENRERWHVSFLKTNSEVMIPWLLFYANLWQGAGLSAKIMR